MDDDALTSFALAEGYRLRLRQIPGETPDAPTLVFLHEGLGTIAVWGDVPEALCRASGCPGVNYERPGYGASDPRPSPWPPDVLEQEAELILPALLEALRIDRPVLIGHFSTAARLPFCTLPPFRGTGARRDHSGGPRRS